MFDTDSLLRQAVSAFAPSDAVFSRVKDRIRGKAQKAQSSVVLVYVDKDLWGSTDGFSLLLKKKGEK